MKCSCSRADGSVKVWLILRLCEVIAVVGCRSQGRGVVGLLAWGVPLAVIVFQHAWAAEPLPCSLKFGDLNFDLRADICDLQALVNNYGTENLCADLNQDGQVNAYDYYLLSEIISREPQPCAEQPGALQTVEFHNRPSDSLPVMSSSRLLMIWSSEWWPWWGVLILLLLGVLGAAAWDRRRARPPGNP